MAVGAWLSDTSVTAHSYTTAVLMDCSSARMILMYFPFCDGSFRHTCGNSHDAVRIQPHNSGWACLQCRWADDRHPLADTILRCDCDRTLIMSH